MKKFIAKLKRRRECKKIEKSLKITCPVAPLQIEGFVDDRFIYFRERHGEWSLGIEEFFDDAVTDPVVYGTCKEFASASDVFPLIVELVMFYKENKSDN